MSEVVVVYWSGTGNTEAMAGFVGQGIKEGGKEAKVVSVGDITPGALKDCPVFALGCHPWEPNSLKRAKWNRL